MQLNLVKEYSFSHQMLKFSHLHLFNSSPSFSLISSCGKNSTGKKNIVTKSAIFTKIYLAWNKDGSNTWFWEPYPSKWQITNKLHDVLAKISLQKISAGGSWHCLLHCPTTQRNSVPVNQGDGNKTTVMTKHHPVWLCWAEDKDNVKT